MNKIEIRDNYKIRRTNVQIICHAECVQAKNEFKIIFVDIFCFVRYFYFMSLKFKEIKNVLKLCF